MATHSIVLAWRIPWTEEPGGLQSMGFSRQGYWSRLLLPSPGDLPNPGIEPGLPQILYRLGHQESPHRRYSINKTKPTGKRKQRKSNLLLTLKGKQGLGTQTGLDCWLASFPAAVLRLPSLSSIAPMWLHQPASPHSADTHPSI